MNVLPPDDSNTDKQNRSLLVFDSVLAINWKIIELKIRLSICGRSFGCGAVFYLEKKPVGKHI